MAAPLETLPVSDGGGSEFKPRRGSMSRVSDVREMSAIDLLAELEVLAWIGPAGAAMIAEQHDVRSADATALRLQACARTGLVQLADDGRYSLTDDGYAALRRAIDGES
jgi:hypothetical protein